MKNTNGWKRRSALGLALLMVALAMIPVVEANHIRVMVVTQSGGNGNFVTLRVDFNYSGECCGGTFRWTTGESPQRHGAVSDGIGCIGSVCGQYLGDASGTGTLTGSYGGTFTWTRTQPDPNIMLVRIDITYEYRDPGAYMVSWEDCCPQSDTTSSALVAVSTGVMLSDKILAITQVGNTRLEDAFKNAAIPPCPGGPPVCYEMVTVLDFNAFTNARFAEYRVLVVGSDSDLATITALNLQKTKISLFVHSGNGLVAFGQGGSIPGEWSWVPGAAPPVGVAKVSQTVSTTVKGDVHRSHVNQIANGPNALNNWGPSQVNAFTSWPAEFNQPIAGALSTDADGDAVSLAGKFTVGCVFLSGQPVDARAPSVLAAEQLFRASIDYVMPDSAARECRY